MTPGSPQFEAKLEQLRAAYAERLPLRIAQLERRWLSLGSTRPRDELHALRCEAHSLYGSAAIYRFGAVSTAAKSLERALAALYEPAGAPQPPVSVKDALEELRRAIEAVPFMDRATAKD